MSLWRTWIQTRLIKNNVTFNLKIVHIEYLLVTVDSSVCIVFYWIACVINKCSNSCEIGTILITRVRDFISRAAAIMKSALLLSSWSDIICMINKDPDKGWFHLSAHNVHVKFIRRIFCVSDSFRRQTSRAINPRGTKDKGGGCIFITFLISILLSSNYDRLMYASCRWNMPFFWTFPRIMIFPL